VKFATQEGTAANGSDFMALEKSTLTFTPGTLMKRVSVKIVGDLVSEDDETFSLVLSEPTNATVAEDGGQAIIFDNEGGAANLQAQPKAAAEEPSAPTS
jgi:hypothetical protein